MLRWIVLPTAGRTQTSHSCCRPSVGKTALALNLARNAALHSSKPTPVAVFSLEMSAGQLVQRILAAESEIWLEKIARGN
jgi:replicative DNA helicase